jgi:diaminohydroxyphosphoribosylaminopyrimidine deaminase/5-amino-6-(5-phosphoribosylamino)uracil reductase
LLRPLCKATEQTGAASLRPYKKLMQTNEAKWMRLALALARQGEGLTRPNPPVGAMLVARGKKIGAGFHRIAGGPHAEVVALLDAGQQAHGATLYVTLEPCSTWGRTPPCTDAILAAGIARVVVGATDPNPKHAGRGLELLQRQGVSVTAGICRAEAEELIAPFAKQQHIGRPWVTLKLAQTLDGRIADARGASRWLTSPEARGAVQALRRRADAIMVGGETVRADNPSLWPRPDEGRCPVRVVVTASGNLPPNSNVLSDSHAACTLIATTPTGARRLARVKTAAHIWTLPARGGKLDLAALLHKLGERGYLHLLCEGGGQLAGGLLRAKLVDELQLFIAPKILGGDATAAIGGGWKLSEAPGMEILKVDRIGPDLLLRARPQTTDH